MKKMNNTISNRTGTSIKTTRSSNNNRNNRNNKNTRNIRNNKNSRNKSKSKSKNSFTASILNIIKKFFNKIATSIIDRIKILSYYIEPLKEFIVKNIVYISILFVVIMGILLSPFFSISDVSIINNGERFTNTQIKNELSVSEGDNLIFFNKIKARKKLEENSYISSVTIEKKIPNALKVTVVERKVRGYVPYMGAYLYIDEEARVLETKKTYYEPLPEVVGLNFAGFVLGEVLDVENVNSLEVVLQMSQMIQKYELLAEVLKIDVSDVNDIHIYINNVDVTLGDMSEIDQKVRVIAEIIKTIPEEDRGTLDISDINKPYIFKYLT